MGRLLREGGQFQAAAMKDSVLLTGTPATLLLSRSHFAR